MKKALIVFLVFLFFVAGATIIVAGSAPESATEEAAAMTADTDIVLVGGRFTWPANWLQAPTASELGITEFSEAPTLAAMVARGELPPVEDRLPDDPLVIGPYAEIGEYGGELRVARKGPRDYGDMLRGKHVFLFRADPSSAEIIPSLAKGYEASSDNRALTIYLREGAKWSDGMPFTADDIMFMYTYVMADPDVNYWVTRGWTFEGELSKFEKIDDHAVRITFPVPVSPALWKSHLNWFRTRQSFLFTAAHWAQEYHKAFNPEVEKLAKEEGHESWDALFLAAIDTQPSQSFVQPEMTTWIIESRDSSGIQHVRNPYYWAVDPEGNQLPYIDSLYAEFFADSEVAILNMMQGSIDIGGRLMNPADFPLYKENEGIGDYTIREWQDTKTGRVVYGFNLNIEDPVKAAIFQDDRFRHAMSLAINREEINEFAFQGLATPQQFTVTEAAEFYDPSWARAYADYDPERAMRLLDELDLRDIDGDGFREGPGGEPFLIELNINTSSVMGTMGFSTTELVAEYWQEVGIRTDYRQISSDLNRELRDANQLDVHVGVAEGYMPTRVSVPGNFTTGATGYALNWRDWVSHQYWLDAGSKGDEPARGEEPPEKWKRFVETKNAWVSAQSDDEFKRLGREYWSMQAELIPVIGTVGYALRPILINNRIRNVPETLPFAWETVLWVNATPAQWFIRD